MYIDTSELCDIYADQVDVVEPIFSSFGGVSDLPALTFIYFSPLWLLE